MKLRALAPRVISALIIAQILAFLLGWVVSTAMGMAGVGVTVTSFNTIAILRAQRQVINSLVSDEGNIIRIEPSQELLDELRRAPTMRFAVFDGDGRALAGSDPVLVSFLSAVVALNPVHTHFGLPGDVDRAPVGYMEPKQTSFGRFIVAVHGQVFRWSDIVDSLVYSGKRFMGYLATALILSTASAWIAVRKGLTPLRQVAHEADMIDLESLGKRLTLEVTPTEVAPLVRAINRALERLDVAARRQRRFIANAAHELRTPVAILAARLHAPRVPDFENQLERDVWRISHVIQQLLAEMRAVEKVLPLDETIDIVELTHSVVDDAALLAVLDGRDIEYLGAADSVLVRSNKGAIEAVLVNLVDNALRVEPEGGTVAVRVESDATIAVVDHGPGVAAEDRQHIFEPFWRKNEEASGAGLGLAIAKELMTRIGGHIWVEDTPGGGATFKLSVS